METGILTERHQRYLKRFKRQRKGWDLNPQHGDLERLRISEKGQYVLLLLFQMYLYRMFKDLFPWSWSTSLMFIFTASFICYLIYELYWTSRTIDVMLKASAQEVSELPGFESAE